jgi:hypothetical protein
VLAQPIAGALAGAALDAPELLTSMWINSPALSRS